MDVLRHPPPLVLLGRDDRRGEGPSLGLLAPQVVHQAAAGERHGGLGGEPLQAVEVAGAEGRAAPPGDRQGARRVGHRGQGHVPRQPRRAAARDGRHVGGVHRDGRVPVAGELLDRAPGPRHEERRGVGAGQRAGLRHGDVAGRRGRRRLRQALRHPRQGAEPARLAVELAGPVREAPDQRVGAHAQGDQRRRGAARRDVGPPRLGAVAGQQRQRPLGVTVDDRRDHHPVRQAERREGVRRAGPPDHLPQAEGRGGQRRGRGTDGAGDAGDGLRVAPPRPQHHARRLLRAPREVRRRRGRRWR